MLPSLGQGLVARAIHRGVQLIAAVWGHCQTCGGCPWLWNWCRKEVQGVLLQHYPAAKCATEAQAHVQRSSPIGRLGISPALSRGHQLLCCVLAQCAGWLQ